jgi:1-acyl-sn-glycerol-3-phosphate acyltransferase
MSRSGEPGRVPASPAEASRGQDGGGAAPVAPPPDRPRSRLQDLLQRVFFALVIRPFLAIFVGLRVRGRENLPVAEPFILIANHSSHLDAISLLSLFPGHRLRHIRPVAAADYFERSPLVGWLTRTFFNTLPIVRRDVTAENDPRPRMLATLRAGDSLILFPEGTRGASEGIGRFRTGVANLVQNLPSVPVVPAFLENMGRSLPKGEYLPVPFFCGIVIGPPLLVGGTQEEILEALQAAVRSLQARE